MGRVKVNTVDYFSHDADGSEKKPVPVLRQKFGNDGYVIWYTLRESLASSTGHYLILRDEDEIDQQAVYCGVETPILATALDYLASRRYIDPELWDVGIVWVPEFVESVAHVYANRKRAVPSKPLVEDWADNSITTVDSAITTGDNGITTVEMPHRIAKDSKTKDSNLPKDRGSGGKSDSDIKNDLGTSRPVVTKEKYLATVNEWFDRHEADLDWVAEMQTRFDAVDVIHELVRMRAWLKEFPKRRKGGKKLDFGQWVRGWLDRSNEKLRKKGGGEKLLPAGVPTFVDFLMEINGYMNSFDGSKYKRRVENEFSKWVFEEIFGGIFTYRETGAGYLNTALEKSYKLGVDKWPKMKKVGG